MSSLFWYICLTVIGVGIAAFAIYTKRHAFKISTLAVFYLFTASVTWIGEFTVLGIFDSYAYKPGISTDPWAENLVGHLFLNVSMFPAAALLMVTYSLGYLGVSLITAAFILIEYLFVKLGIYEHHWWKYYMSGINTVVFLVIVTKWFAKIKHAQYNIPRLFTFYFVGFLIIHTPAPLLLLLGKQYYSLGLIDKIVGNMYRSSIIFIFSYHLIEIAFLVFFVCVLDKWYWKLVPFIIAIVGQRILAKMNILIFMEGWKLIYTIIIYTVCLAAFILIEKHTLKPD
ncbi:MAG TPA: hypothetical protein VEB00_05705 [Clostridia bacterium]|nr:hypothetical protein [Clostridia bacterium]